MISKNMQEMMIKSIKTLNCWSITNLESLLAINDSKFKESAIVSI